VKLRARDIPRIAIGACVFVPAMAWIVVAGTAVRFFTLSMHVAKKVTDHR
jgi:hypothetical protein